ncbi:MAG TPA: GAF domain-containing sensor histidine kinase, partial [Anaerolineales bacterium]
ILLSRGKSQVVVPIRRTSDVIGIILLESEHTNAYQEEIIAFLSRLSDHAAIAISNAQLYADLQAANIAKSDFVSLVSHELKTPMTSIRGYTDLLAQGAVGPINEVQTNFLNTIRSNVHRMATLVSDLADISRIEAGRMRLEFSSIDLSELIEEVVRTQQGQIDEKEQTLKMQIASGLPAVWGDHNRITQILVNLLSNATKYTPQGGVITLSAERTNYLQDGTALPEVVCVSVQDSGYGISPKEQKQIFQKFFRSEDENIRESPGTGLGLNITRHLVEMQGGQIWFESELSKGTTFHFTIPIAATE